MTLKVMQVHRKHSHSISIGRNHFLLMVSSNNVSVLHGFQDISTFTVYVNGHTKDPQNNRDYASVATQRKDIATFSSHKIVVHSVADGVSRRVNIGLHQLLISADPGVCQGQCGLIS